LNEEGLGAPCRALGKAARLLLAGSVTVVATAVGGPAQAGEVYSNWRLPDHAYSETGQPAAPSIFGTVALPVRARQTGTRWTKLMGASLDQPALKRLAAKVRGQPQLQQAAYVQKVVHHAMRARSGAQDCSDDGYWAAGGETLTRGLGDCFDIAIAKMEALRSLGFSHRDLYLTTGYFRPRSAQVRRRGTAALLVRVNDSFVLLPDGVDTVIPAGHDADALGAFQPYITYGYGKTWVHGRRVRSAEAGSHRGSPLAALAQ
jgi:predicted transglutaminase-like cysteine proteinase